MKKLSALLLAVFCSNLSAYVPKTFNLTCVTQKQFICSKESCAESSSHSTIKLTQVSKAKFNYNRCDSVSCEKYEALLLQSGVNVEFSLVGKNTHMTINLDGMSFLELYSKGLSAYIAFGICNGEVFHNNSKAYYHDNKAIMNVAPSSPTNRLDIPEEDDAQ